MKGSAAIRKASITSKKLAVSIAKFASDKKADDVVVLDMRKQVNFCDYFVICSGSSDRQVKAIADHLEEELESLGVTPASKGRMRHSNWIVLDTGDVIAHIFQSQAREFYNLEGLWQEAKQIDWQK